MLYTEVKNNSDSGKDICTVSNINSSFLEHISKSSSQYDRDERIEMGHQCIYYNSSQKKINNVCVLNKLTLTGQKLYTRQLYIGQNVEYSEYIIVLNDGDNIEK